MTLILASESPRRRQLLKEHGLSFRVIPSRLPEPPPGKLPPVAYARMLAAAKAKRVAAKTREGLVLAADTIVVGRGEILGKPKDFRDACRMLKKLQGTTHRVVTAVCLINAATGGTLTRHCISRVTMRPLTPAEIHRYASRHPDKSGSYAVQEKKDPVVIKIEGSWTNVVGLPMELVKKLLATFC